MMVNVIHKYFQKNHCLLHKYANKMVGLVQARRYENSYCI